MQMDDGRLQTANLMMPASGIFSLCLSFLLLSLNLMNHQVLICIFFLGAKYKNIFLSLCTFFLLFCEHI